MLTREEFDKVFEQAIAASKSIEKALTDPALGNLVSLISAIGNVKSEPVYEAVATA